MSSTSQIKHLTWHYIMSYPTFSAWTALFGVKLKTMFQEFQV